MTDALVIGGGPAGLMAADVLSAAGKSVLLADRMPTVGRKFLMAGKSGLNITKDEPLSDFIRAYGDAGHVLRGAVEGFDPETTKRWAVSLGQDIFTGSTGRVFPKSMKASPLLRSWLSRLDQQDVEMRTRWRWTGWQDGDALFETPDGQQRVSAKVTVLALGGASWARLGSDGAWAAHLPDQTAAFRPANMGFKVPWSTHMTPYFGAAVKGVGLTAGAQATRGEFVVSERGIEGGGVYMVSSAVRDGAVLELDLLPDLPVEQVEHRLSSVRGKASLSNVLRKALKLDGVKRALFNELGRDDERPVAQRLKALRFPRLQPRPMDEAISTAGGVRFDALTNDLELRDREGVFCAGEMLDWEAPTGGYLITACLATGQRAGQAALRRLQTL